MIVTTVKTTNLVNEIESTLDQFFATATDDEFWRALEDAKWSEFSKIDLPIVDYHNRATRYVVTAKHMSAPQRAHGLPRTVCNVHHLANNNNELALAA